MGIAQLLCNSHANRKESLSKQILHNVCYTAMSILSLLTLALILVSTRPNNTGLLTELS